MLDALRVQNCVFLKAMAGFGNADHPQVVSRAPYNAVGTADGTRWIITAWLPESRLWNNPRNPCLHSDPMFPACPPGATRTVYGWFSFYQGRDVRAEFARIDATGWKEDPWNDQPRWNEGSEAYR